MKTAEVPSICHPRRMSLLWLAAVMFISHGCFSRSARSGEQGPKDAKDMSVYVDIRGDLHLSHRFSEFLAFSLEDAGIERAKSESEANFVISGEVDERVETHEIGAGIVRLQLSQGDNVTKKENCAGLNSDADGEIFGGTAKNLASTIREIYPAAHTVKFDISSDTKASQVFSDELPMALKNQGFVSVSTGKADLDLRVDLQKQKVTVAERMAHYEIASSWKGEGASNTSTGTSVVSAKVAGPVPDACKTDFEDLSWLGNGSLYTDASMITKSLRRECLRRQSVPPQADVSKTRTQ